MYPGGASWHILAEIIEWGIKVIRHRDESADAPKLWSVHQLVQGHKLDQWLLIARNNDFLAVFGGLNEIQEAALRFGDVDLIYRGLPPLKFTHPANRAGS